MDLVMEMRGECWDHALHAFGTKWIFEQRANKLRFRLRLMEFLGIVVPVFVGGFVAAFGLDFQYLFVVMLLASVVSIVQLVVSVWSLVARWNDEFSYANESMTANQRLSDLYKALGSDPPENVSEMRQRMTFVNIERRDRDDQDSRQGITEPEKRAGMRAALRQFQRRCAQCDQIPRSLESTDCPVCGMYRRDVLGNIKDAKEEER